MFRFEVRVRFLGSGSSLDLRFGIVFNEGRQCFNDTMQVLRNAGER